MFTGLSRISHQQRDRATERKWIRQIMFIEHFGACLWSVSSTLAFCPWPCKAWEDPSPLASQISVKELSVQVCVCMVLGWVLSKKKYIWQIWSICVCVSEDKCTLMCYNAIVFIPNFQYLVLRMPSLSLIDPLFLKHPNETLDYVWGLVWDKLILDYRGFQTGIWVSIFYLFWSILCILGLLKVNCKICQ